MRQLLLASLLLIPLAAHAKPVKHRSRVKHAKKKAVVNVKWYSNFDEAAKVARRTGRPMFVDFYTDWCVACKYLDRTTYRDPKFARVARRWVLVKVNAEKGARNIQIAQKYRPEYFPTMLMVDGRGKKLNQVVGTYPASMLLPEMRKAEKNMGVLFARSPRASHAG